MSRLPLRTEATAQGTQVLLPGVSPITPRDRLQLLMDAPLLPRRPQKPCNVGLFDEAARNQLDLFIHQQRKER